MEGEILREIFKAIAQENDTLVYEALQKIIKLERQKKNYALSNELKKIISPKKEVFHRFKQNPLRILTEIPRDSTNNIPLLDIRNYTIPYNQLIVNKKITKVLDQIIHEYNEQSILKIYNMKNTSRLLFFGPPGCGKTLTAKILSAKLNLPLVYVKFDGLISSYLGETANNLQKIFNFISEGEWVLFFDEFDALGKSREDYYDNGEMKRVINCLLQQLDNYHGNALIICATNFYQNLDPALWRRFDELVFFDLPKNYERRRLFKLFLSDFPKDKIDYIQLAKKTESLSGSNIENVCKRVIKNSIFNEKNIVMKDILAAIEEEFERNKFKTQFTKRID